MPRWVYDLYEGLLEEQPNRSSLSKAVTWKRVERILFKIRDENGAGIPDELLEAVQAAYLANEIAAHAPQKG